MAVDPAKAGGVEVRGPERRVPEVQPVQVAHHAVERVVDRVLQQHPVLLALFVPLAELAELAAHEVQLLARVRVHVQVQRAPLREFPRVVAVHLLQNRRLAVHVFVVRKRQKEAVAVVVRHRERQLVVVAAAVFGRGAEIIERVVHPPHVPLVVEAEAARLRRLGNAGVRGGVLRAEHRRRVQRLQPAVHPAQELDRRAVHAAGRVALPVDHAADRVHAQAVDVEFLEPVVRRRLQKAAHLAARVHEVAAAPLAAADVRVRVLVEGGAVVAGERVAVHREVHGHKVEQDADAAPVAGVDEVFELVQRAVARGRAEKAGGLVAPGFVARVFAERHDLDVVVALLFHIRHEPFRDLPVRVPAVRRGARLFERAEVHLIDVERSRFAVGPRAHPAAVAEGVAVQPADDRGRVRPQLHAEAVGVAVVDEIRLRGVDPVFVHRARRGLRHAAGPEIAVARALHRQLLPPRARGDQRDALCGGRKGAEHRARFLHMRAEVFVRVERLARVKIQKLHTPPPER